MKLKITDEGGMLVATNPDTGKRYLGNYNETVAKFMDRLYRMLGRKRPVEFITKSKL